MGIGKSKIIKYDYQLCDELIEEILSRLPLSSLIKCRYVSKSWSSLISNVLAIHRQRISPTFCSIGLHSTFLPPSSGVEGELRVLYPSTTLMELEAADCYVGEQILWFRRLLVAHSHPETAATAASEEEDTIMMEVAKYMNLYCDTELLDSCNGLLFLRCSSSSSSVAAAGHVVYYVCNPVLDQWAALPDHYQQYYPKKKIVSVFDDDDNVLDLDDCLSCILGFAFDGIQGHHYTVVSFTWQPAAASTDDDNDDTLISCEIFSSETGRWRDHRAPILNSLTNSSLHDGIGIKKGSPIKKRSLYWKGAIHWLFALDNRYMLLFYLDKEVFEFIKLPPTRPPHHGHIDDDPTPGSGRVVKCLWESDKGCLHYCSNAFSRGISEFHVWTYLDDDDCSSNEQRWVLKQTVDLIVMWQLPIENPYKIMICMYSSSSSINDNGTTTTTFMVPCGWYRDMQAVYIQTMLTVFSNGGFEKKRQVVCWSCNNMSRSIIRKAEKEGYSIIQRPLKGALYPYLFNLVELPTWDGCRLLKQPDRFINTSERPKTEGLG